MIELGGEIIHFLLLELIDSPLSVSTGEVAKGVLTVEGYDGVGMKLSAVDQVETIARR
jgi:hypothetical protein